MEVLSKYHDVVKSTAAADGMMVKTAFTTDQNRKKIDSNERELKAIKKSIKDLERDLKSVVKQIDSLNIGQRRFWQKTSIWTSLQRKLERLEKVEQEWKKFKQEMAPEIKKLVEKSNRASVR